MNLFVNLFMNYLFIYCNSFSVLAWDEENWGDERILIDRSCMVKIEFRKNLNEFFFSIDPKVEKRIKLQVGKIIKKLR